MDQPELDATEHQAALIGLHRVNLVSGVASMMWRRLKRLAVTYSARRPLRVLDVASGGGDVAIQLASWAQSSGVPLQIHGCDFSPRAIRHAETSARDRQVSDVNFFQLNVLNDPFPDQYDVIICSLFLHHLQDLEAVTVLRKMAAAAQRAVLVDDLLRSYLGYVFCLIGSRLLSRSRIVHLDGLQSVRAAFTLNEAQSLAHQSGLEGARFQTRWPERFFMSWTLQ